MLDRIKQALARKLGPQPAWAWLSELAAALYWYRKHQAAAAGTSTTATVPNASSAPDYSAYPAYTPASPVSPVTSGDAGAGGGDQPLGGATTPPVYYDPNTDSYLQDILAALQGSGAGGDSGGGGGDSGPAPAVYIPPASTTTGVNTTPRPRMSQPLLAAGAPGTVTGFTGAGVTSETPLQWGGERFVTQSQFQAWAKAHGTSVARELENHPEAARIYAQLGANLGSKPAPAQTKTLPKTGSVLSRARPNAAKPTPDVRPRGGVVAQKPVRGSTPILGGRGAPPRRDEKPSSKPKAPVVVRRSTLRAV